jgi:hypothetical protein
MNRGPELFNTIRSVLAESGVCEQIADRVVTEVGELYLGAIHDAVLEHVDEGASAPRPQRLGLTETQAAMRWCPMVREVIEPDKKTQGIGNRYLDNGGGDYTNPAGARCIGSMCLCWRWDSKRRGHCGLVGPVTHQPPGEPRRITHRTALPRPDESIAKDLELIVDNE